MRISPIATSLLVLALFAPVVGAHAQQPPPAGSITGSEPPQKRSAPQPPATPVAPASPVEAPVETTLTPDFIARKITEISQKVSSFQGRISLGKGVLDKWAGTAELFLSYAKAQQDNSLNCRLTKDKLSKSEERGASEVLLIDLRKEVKDCEAESARSRSQQSKFKEQLAKVQEAVTKIEADVVEYGTLVDNNAKELKKLEIEKNLGNRLDAVNSATRAFQSKGK